MLTARSVTVVAASAVVISFFVAVQPAAAQGSTPVEPHAICHGVVNQLGERGTVEAQLIEAAARQNAELIAQLEVELGVLQVARANLEMQIALTQQQLGELDAQRQGLEARIQQLQLELAEL